MVTPRLEGQQSQQDIKKGQLGEQIGTSVKAVAKRRTRGKSLFWITLLTLSTTTCSRIKLVMTEHKVVATTVNNASNKDVAA